jgi:hypothetical protein
MDEISLLKLWNEKRTQIISAQIAPTLVLIAVFIPSAQGTFKSANDASKYLAIAVAGVTGMLSMLSQYAAIREAELLLVDLSKIENASALSKIIATSRYYLSLTAIFIVGFGLGVFTLVVWSVLGKA